VRFIVMHRTSAHWEAGALPTPELIARVGGLLGELAGGGALLAAEGLRPSSQGVRLRFSAGRREVIEGPFEGGGEPWGFSILRLRSLAEAVEWASGQAAALGDVEIDIRPVTEPWDIGMGEKPADVVTQRFMLLRRAATGTDTGTEPSSARRTALSRLIEDATRAGVHVVTETLRPSARGRRYKSSRDGVTFVDGPFVETKELIGGYVVVEVPSLDDAGRWAMRYIEVVEADEVDVRELE
jgi:hypothetical protein